MRSALLRLHCSTNRPGLPASYLSSHKPPNRELDRLQPVWPVLNNLPVLILSSAPSKPSWELWSLSQGLSHVLRRCHAVRPLLTPAQSHRCVPHLSFPPASQMLLIPLWLTWIEFCCLAVRTHNPHAWTLDRLGAGACGGRRVGVVYHRVRLRSTPHLLRLLSSVSPHRPPLMSW